MQVRPTVYWATLEYNPFTLHLAATEDGLCYIALPNETFDMLQKWVTKHVQGSMLVHDEIKMVPYLEQMTEYLYASRKVFTIPLDLRGTPFQIKVWDALLRIPFGETQSYSQICSSIGNPNAVRAVGAANGPIQFRLSYLATESSAKTENSPVIVAD